MDRAKRVLCVSAAVEAVTGGVAITAPSFLVWLLFATPLAPGGELIGRVAGIALIALAIASWPQHTGSELTAVRALLVYNAGAAIVFLVVGLGSAFVGYLLWPAFVFHSVIAALLFIRKNR